MEPAMTEVIEENPDRCEEKPRIKPGEVELGNKKSCRGTKSRVEDGNSGSNSLNIPGERFARDKEVEE